MMQLRLIRNATLRLEYAGVSLLIDPMLGVVGSVRALGGVAVRNPTVELPCPVTEVLEGIDGVIVSHVHPDHFDDAAFGLLRRNLPILCQSADVGTLNDAGFTDVVPIVDSITWNGLRLTATAGTHGTGAVAEKMGEVTGFVLRAEDEPTVYFAGDTVLYPPVLDVIDTTKPDVIVVHSGGAAIGDTLIIMDPADTVEVGLRAPDATVVAIHFEAIALCSATRAEMRAAADDADIPAARLLIPTDGETITIDRSTATLST
jgi:L-ascorbate metabolism protein UlaG (beta-lactamase superfamily)